MTAVGVPVSEGLFPHINVVLVAPGADLASWVATAPAAVTTLAVLGLVDGSECHVLRHDAPLDDLPPIPPAPGPSAEQVAAMRAMPNPAMWLVLGRTDGTVVFLDAPVVFNAPV